LARNIHAVELNDQIDRDWTLRYVPMNLGCLIQENGKELIMARRLAIAILNTSMGMVLVGAPLSYLAQTPARWKAHDTTRPRPPVVKPASQKLPVAPPADALVLFAGEDLSQWRSADGGPAKWIATKGYMESVKGSGYIFTRQSFGDVQLHVEWATPVPAVGKSQGRGNSGVFLMGLYEIQVLDSYENDTYPDGQAASVYGQYPPLVNACLPPGEWQSYDIFFRRDRSNADGKLIQPARVTVVHNALLVQDNVEIWGPTNWLQHSPYKPHPDKLPLSLQDHGNPVRYRNIWLRELPEWTPPGPNHVENERVLILTQKELDGYVGKYQVASGDTYRIIRDGDLLKAHFYGETVLELVPRSTREFALSWTAGKVVFDLNGQGVATGLTFHLGGEQRAAKKVD
jgi:hypothetical protein